MNVMTRFTGSDGDEPQPFRLRFEDYELLFRSGTFQDRRVELIEGLLIEMSPQRTPHSYTKNEINYRLRLALEALGSTLSAQSEVTLPLGPQTAPEPDIVLTSAPRGGEYIPFSSVALVVEIVDTSLRHDLGDKKRLYAGVAIGEYWVIDITSRNVHQFWSADSGTYTCDRDVPLAGPIASATIPGLAIDGSGIL